MKRVTISLLLLTGICVLASCGYDDGGDIPFITPVDSTATGKAELTAHITTNSIYDKKIN